jgi:hypothetical protein
MWVNIFVRVVIARTVGVLFAWAVVVARAVVAMAVNFRSLAVNSRGMAGWCCWWCKCCRGQIVAMPRWFVVGVNTAIVVALVVAAAHAAYPPTPHTNNLPQLVPLSKNVSGCIPQLQLGLATLNQSSRTCPRWPSTELRVLDWHQVGLVLGQEKMVGDVPTPTCSKSIDSRNPGL